MALAKCRECGHQVAKSAPTCPNCGVKDPGKSPLDIKIGGCGGCLAIIVVIWLVGSLASVFESDNGPSTVAVPAPTPLRRWVWSAANVREGRGTNTPVVRTLPAGTEIGVMNAQNNWWEVYIAGQQIGFIANSVIHGTRSATVRRQRPSQPSQRTSGATGVVANKFEIKFHITGTKLTLSIETDLPDDTNVMVSISRVYTEVGSSERYVVDYFSEKSKIGTWRREHTVDIDNERWKRTLQERQQLFARIGEPFTVANIDDFIEVGFTVPVNQENPRFGRRNENLVGSVVTQSGPLGLRIVRDEVRINDPLEGNTDSPVFASPNDLILGFAYRLSRETPLMPEFEPRDPLAAVARVKSVPAGGTITVLEIRVKLGDPWYRVLALSPNEQEIGEGWVNSIALILQEIVIVRR